MYSMYILNVLTQTVLTSVDIQGDRRDIPTLHYGQAPCTDSAQLQPALVEKEQPS